MELEVCCLCPEFEFIGHGHRQSFRESCRSSNWIPALKLIREKKFHYGKTLIIRTALIRIYNTNVISKYPIYYYNPMTRTGPFLPAEINPHLVNTIYFI